MGLVIKGVKFHWPGQKRDEYMYIKFHWQNNQYKIPKFIKKQFQFYACRQMLQYQSNTIKKKHKHDGCLDQSGR